MQINVHQKCINNLSYFDDLDQFLNLIKNFL